MKYSEFLQLRELIEKEQELEIQQHFSLNEGLLGNLFKMGGKALWQLIQKNARKAISSGIETEFKDKLDKDAETIKQALVKKLNIKQNPNTEETPSIDPLYQQELKKEVQAYQKILKKYKGRENSYIFLSLVNNVFKLTKTYNDEDLNKSILAWFENKDEAEGENLKKQIFTKVEEDKGDKEPIGGDEVLQKLDQESDAILAAVLQKRDIAENTEQADKIKAQILSSRDKKVIQYMKKVLANESAIVLKSIEDKEKLEKEDKQNLKLFWESKMTVLEIELSMLLASMGYIEERNLESSFGDWMAELKNYA